MDKKTCVIVVGPTAVGKTSVGIQLASHYYSEVISADSRQCYKELNIGVAKPSIPELKKIPHYFINSHSIHEEVNAKTFGNYALNIIENIFIENDIAFMVGGTGLYIKAFCEGLDEIPMVDKLIKKELNEHYVKFGMQWVQNQLKILDPVYYKNGEIMNPHRSLRALSVKISTGKSILDFHTSKNCQRNFNIIKIGLQLPRERLIQNINSRVEAMIKRGLVKEVNELKDEKHLQGLQTVGYSELFKYLNNEISLEKAIDQIKINTRQYAKRQMTWFRNDKQIKWFDANVPLAQILCYINKEFKSISKFKTDSC